MLSYATCPSKCLLKCLKKNKSEDLYSKAMTYYEQEIDIIEMIRNFREVRVVLREYMMRKQQGFSIDKTSELGFLQSVMDQGEFDDDPGTPFSTFINIKGLAEPASAASLHVRRNMFQKRKRSSSNDSI